MHLKDKSITACFSGHRELKPAVDDLFSGSSYRDQEEFEAVLREKAHDAVRRLYSEGYRIFLCGMAEGFDMLAGEVVLELAGELPGMELTAVIPHPGQAYGFGAAAKERYAKLLEGAAQKITVCPNYRPDCFHRRNDYLADNGSALVCFYNGSKGGTQYTVKKALKEGLRIINLA